MARIEAAPKTWRHPLVTIGRWYAERHYGRALEPGDVTAHHPRLASGYGFFEWSVERSKRVDAKLKDLGAMKAAAIIGCEFCMDIGSHLSRESGLTDDQLRDLPRYRESELFSELEKDVIELGERMTRVPVEVPEELFDRLRQRLDEGQLVELITAMAIENFRARFNQAFGMTPAGFSEGAFCIRPEQPAKVEEVAAQ